jgi:hypothetical protein
MRIPHFGGMLKINVDSFSRKHGAEPKLLPDPSTEAFRPYQATLDEIAEIEKDAQPFLKAINERAFEFLLHYGWDDEQQTERVYASSLAINGSSLPMVTFHRQTKSGASAPADKPDSSAEPTINPLEAESAGKTYSTSTGETRNAFISRIVTTLQNGLLSPYIKYRDGLK